MAALPPTAGEWGYRGPQDDTAWNHYINQWVREPSGNYVFRPHKGTFSGSVGYRGPQQGEFNLAPPNNQTAPSPDMASAHRRAPNMSALAERGRGNTNFGSMYNLAEQWYAGQGGGINTSGGGMGFDPYEMPQMNTPQFQGIHGRLNLRQGRRRNNTLLDMLVNRPRQYNRLNENVGGNLTSMLFSKKNQDKNASMLGGN